MTVDACDRVFHQLPGFGVGHGVHALEALDQISPAQRLVGHIDRRVALHAGAGLLGDHLAFGERLILEHEGVAPLFAEVDGKGIPRPHGLQAGIVFETGLGHDGPGIRIRRRSRHRLAAAELRADLVGRLQVSVVLQGEVLAPARRVFGVVGERHHTEERIARLLFVFHHAEQERRKAGDDDGAEPLGEDPAHLRH